MLTSLTHSSLGTDPGMLIVHLTKNGRSAKVPGLVHISNIDAGGVERADAHGIRVRLTHSDESDDDDDSDDDD